MIPKKLIKQSNCWKPNNSKGILRKSNSWFTIRYKHHTNKAKVDVIKTANLRCKKVILKPANKVRNILLTWLELYRLTYNITVKFLKTTDKKWSKLKLRDQIKMKRRQNLYMVGLINKSKIPVHTLDNAVFDVFKARKTAFSNLRAGHIRFFRLRYKRKFHRNRTLVIEPSVFNRQGTGFKNKILYDLNPSELISTTKDTRLSYDTKFKQFTLFIPYLKETKNFVHQQPLCCLDPGIRTFQTLYSPSGTVIEIGDEKNIIKKNINRIEKVNKFKKETWHTKFTSRLRKKLQNRITDLHWKTSKFLCSCFKKIQVGNMSTKGISQNRLHSSTKRQAYALSHFIFKQRLKSKAEEYDVCFEEVDESYTSKTCGGCGELHQTLGSSKEFICPQANCGYEMHRDVHGARNIYIKNNC
jgi:IS605 OrfB family transposase